MPVIPSCQFNGGNYRFIFKEAQPFLFNIFQFLNEDDHDAKKAQEIQILEQTLVVQTQVLETLRISLL